MSNFDIDFVILWVDSNDYTWQKSKASYMPSTDDDGSFVRYQNWDNLRYWFRAVALYAPWVRKIHFVTCGQIPLWLNVENPKLHLVSHNDYMPADALPTFNSSAIEVGIHNIQGLADHFVYFNDDVFLTAPITPEFFFQNGVPCDMPGFLMAPQRVEGNVFSSLLVNNSEIIQKHFTKKQILNKRTFEWLNPAMGKTFLRTLRYIGQKEFPGFVIPHLSVPYLKSDFQKVWEQEAAVLQATQHHRFRNEKDVTHFLIRNWRMCEGTYAPRKSKGKYFSVDGINTAYRAARAIQKRKYPEICINEVCTGEHFEAAKAIINVALATRLDKPCEYEKQ